MSAGNETPATATADREIVVSRLIAAPRELVFEAWTSPEHVKNWWGPNGFTTTTHEMEVRPGGVWRFIMHGPDGVDYDNEIHYLEVVPPERIVYDHISTPTFHVTVTFEDAGGKTNLTMHSLFESAEARDHVVQKYGAIEGANQTIGRLAAYATRLFEDRAS